MRSLRALAAAGFISRWDARAVFDTDRWLRSCKHAQSAQEKARANKLNTEQSAGIDAHLLAHRIASR